jgi:ferredoxin
MMGGRIPIKDQSKERIELVLEIEKQSRERQIGRKLAQRLIEALERCPSMSCAFCEHMPRNEQQLDAKNVRL